MDAGGGGGGGGPAPAPRGRVFSRTSSALAAVSVVLILLYLFSRFMWQCRKRRHGSEPTTAAVTSSSSAPPPSCPSQAAAAAYGAWEAARRTPHSTTTTTTLNPVFVRVEAAGPGAEKIDCAVCLGELGDGDGAAAARLVPGCGHGFHVECIEAWFRVNSTCPLCRAAVAGGQSAGEAGSTVLQQQRMMH